VAITAAGKSSAATSGKVVAAANSTNAGLRIANPTDTSLRAAKAAPDRSTVKPAASSAVHPTAAAMATTATAVPTATTSHCWRSKRQSERECRHSNQFEISH
jgi:hypothetical protein